MSRPSAGAYVALFSGLVCVSTSGPFLVMARMDAYAVVLYRMLLSAIVLLAWARARSLGFDRRHLRRICLGGFLLAAHFALWVKAFDLTDFASNLLLLVAQPVMAAALGRAVGEAPTRRTWISIALATIGLLAIARGDFALGPRALLGDLISVVGSAAITLFYAVTRRARAETPLPTFLGLTFVAGSAVMVPICLVAQAPLLAYPAASWAYLAALVLVTTVLGHGLMNLAARHVKLFTLNVVIVLEPAIGIALGALLFDARVSVEQVAGGVLLAAAVAIGLRG